jgi:hypothetical protein
MGPLAFRALIELNHQQLFSEGRGYALQPGMQKAFHEAGRER